jgi:hypothetical protein
MPWHRQIQVRPPISGRGLARIAEAFGAAYVPRVGTYVEHWREGKRGLPLLPAAEPEPDKHDSINDQGHRPEAAPP